MTLNGVLTANARDLCGSWAPCSFESTCINYLTYLFTYVADKGRISRLQDTILEYYRRYGPIYREKIAGETVVHLLSPDYVQTVYQNEGKIPHIVPLLETASMYRRLRQMSPGLGHTW